MIASSRDNHTVFIDSNDGKINQLDLLPNFLGTISFLALFVQLRDPLISIKVTLSGSLSHTRIFFARFLFFPGLKAHLVTHFLQQTSHLAAKSIEMTIFAAFHLC